ncbi:glycosyl hydrolase [Dactylonectria estremocensis]|uniref:Glycosyl hydrolase n=1 Tax=Dactylonectria estremocensis TaxID=1079267 RepID=A0A9P9ENM4_9HYPO|nr:glycosyl hydrolase [Dactylonectria estremocensis]
MSTSTHIKPGARLHCLPAYHLKAPFGWLNDPCAPGFDSSGTYHLFYQWNPKSCDWGDIAWGHFTSHDALTWEHNGCEPVLKPDRPYDSKGIFTGCFYPTGLKGENGQLSIFYSSIQKLPIHWTLPYSRDCAGLAAASSTDGGQTWVKHDLNPILRGEPEGLVVTGFRDPFLATWPALDAVRGERSLYGAISGGVLDQGPTAFFYAVDPKDLCKWNYLGELVDVPVHFCPAQRWVPDFGINWECVNFMSLRNGLHESHFLTFGSEGGFLQGNPTPQQESTVQCVWMAGTLEETKDGPKMVYDYGGILDHGNYYAPNSCEHPITRQRIVWGWLKEDELTLGRRESKGWTGHLSLPRELFLVSIDNVVGALNEPVEDIGSVKVVHREPDGKRRKMIQTLGIRPLDCLRSLRQTKALTWSGVKGMQGLGNLVETQHTNWELEAIINVNHNDGPVGFFIRHSADLSQKTAIIFSPAKDEIAVDRSQSNTEADINKDKVSGPFTLFVVDDDGSEAVEKLHLRIFCDGSVVEVFANDRFALSTVVYSDLQSCSGISWFAKTENGDAVVFESIRLWENLHGEVKSIL